MGTDAWKVFGNSDSSWDAMHFSSSLPVLAHGKLKLNCTDNGSQFVDDLSCGKLTHDANSHAPCEFLPDDENVLLAGIMEDFDLKRLPGSLEDLEDDDIFGNSGGLELELDPQESLSEDMSKISLSDIVGSPIPQYGFSNGTGTVSGEHPYGEHPSRTLFVRNINSNVEDSELRSLFEQYGAIRTMYTACKHRGFVMISYYDIRDARNAMRALQNKPLRRRKLDIHFSIPKDNPSEKDVNQGTLVIFNLDPSVTNEELLKIFGTCGEVKEIRETPQKRHHKFIEFYDVRAADAALKLLNGREIAGKRIKLEPSRPGGVRKNMMFQLNPELEQDDLRSFRHQVGSPIANSPPGNWMQFNGIEHRPLQNLGQIPGFKSSSPPTYNSHLPGLASILPHQVSNSLKIAPIGQKPDAGNYGFQHAHSLPAGKLNEYPGSVSSALSTSNGSVETLSGPQFLWGNSNPYLESPGSSKSHNLGISTQFNPFLGTSQNSRHHVGSAPSGYPLQRQFSHFPESPETSFMGPSALGGSSMNMNPRAVQGNLFDNSMTNFPMLSPPRLNPMFLGGGAYQSFSPTGMEGLNDRMMRARRVESARNELESRKLFQLDLDKIVNGEDTRTTLMIKNIPNKYTSKMLLAAIDENHRGTYDFLYLPIDFKNKCNVGYAFINMLSPAHIIPFYENFNGKKWEKFNSEKVASLAYARIQGKTALIAHFQNSSLMNEDKRCRPILFHSDGVEVDDQDIFIPGLNIPANQPVRLESADSYRTRLVGSQMSSIGADFGGD